MMESIILVLFAVIFIIGCNGTQMDNKQEPVTVAELAQQTEKSIQEVPQAIQKFVLVSEDFKNGESIPSKFTCDDKNISPSLKWNGAPKDTKSFVLTVKDPDAPRGTFTHWIVLNIPGNINEIKGGKSLPEGAIELTNDFGDIGYGGPCPPSGTHRYIFTLYALNVAKINADASNLDEVINRHIIAKAELIGLYKR